MEEPESKTTLSPDEVEAEVASIRTRRRRGFNWTWVIAPVMLLAGIVIGFLGRPMLTPTQSASGKPDVIDLLVAQTRHFKGSPNAPITMLEFSDFQ